MSLLHPAMLGNGLPQPVDRSQGVRPDGPDLGDQVRMVAALGAVTGFDDWAPRLLAEGDREALRRELVAAVHDILRLHPRRPKPKAAAGR